MGRIIRFLERINNGISSLSITIVSLAILCLIGAIAWFGYKAKDDFISFEADDAIDITPTIVEKMKAIGQWEFLAVSDEELIDTTRRSLFSKDELVRIYYGTVHMGIDLADCEPDWIRNEGDTLFVTLPDISLLDDNFIDEARTKSFFETGKWSSSDRKDMYERARQRMLKRCYTKENIETARQNAQEQIQRMLQPIAEPKKLWISFKK